MLNLEHIEPQVKTLIRLLEKEKDYNQMKTAPKQKRINLIDEKNGGAEAGGNNTNDIHSNFFVCLFILYGALVILIDS